MTDQILEFTSYETMREAFRLAKTLRGMSNTRCDELANLSEGHTDKILGPTGRQGFSPLSFDAFCWMFAVKFVAVPDPDREQEMAPFWADRQRKGAYVRTNNRRLSKLLLERAKPDILGEIAKAAGLASGAMRTGSQGSEIMRKLAHARWRKHRKTMRERLRARKLAKSVEAERAAG